VAIRKKTIAYYSCDRCRFQEQETAKHCPEGWRYLNTLIPGKEKQQPEIKALICPTCDEWLKQQLDAICVQERPGEEGVETPGRECTPPLPASGTEQREPCSIGPIRRLFEQGEEGVETPGRECTPPLPASGAEQRAPCSIDPIRRLFEQEEQEQQEVETTGDECPPSPAPSGVEQAETSTEELDADSHECDRPNPLAESEPEKSPAGEIDVAGTEYPPSPAPCGAEQHVPPPIDPIRRLFRQEEPEVETTGSESLPSLLSYGAKPSTIDSIRRLIQHR
jgi:hypothetical protein